MFSNNFEMNLSILSISSNFIISHIDFNDSLANFSELVEY